MKRQDKRRYELFIRVRDFASAHREQFPETSAAGQAFAAVGAAAAAFDTHASARLLAAREGRQAKAALRRAIHEHLKVIARTARLASGGRHEAAGMFALNARAPVAELLTVARAVINGGQSALEPLVPLGVSPTIVAALQALVTSYEQADRERAMGRASAAVAQEGMSAALNQGIDALRTLDVVVPNAGVGDPALMAAWKRARRASPRGAKPKNAPEITARPTSVTAGGIGSQATNPAVPATAEKEGRNAS